MRDDQDNLNSGKQPEIEATLEARIVAWVEGEASAFEVAELERLVAERPELAIFKRRIDAVHELVAEAAKPDEKPLKMADERRAKVLAAIGSDQSSAAGGGRARGQGQPIPFGKTRRHSWWSWRSRGLYFTLSGAVAAGIVALFVMREELGFVYKKPTRPDPSATALGLAPGGAEPEPTALHERDEGSSKAATPSPVLAKISMPALGGSADVLPAPNRPTDVSFDAPAQNTILFSPTSPPAATDRDVVTWNARPMTVAGGESLSLKSAGAYDSAAATKSTDGLTLSTLPKDSDFKFGTGGNITLGSTPSAEKFNFTTPSGGGVTENKARFNDVALSASDKSTDLKLTNAASRMGGVVLNADREASDRIVKLDAFNVSESREAGLAGITASSASGAPLDKRLISSSVQGGADRVANYTFGGVGEFARGASGAVATTEANSLGRVGGGDAGKNADDSVTTQSAASAPSSSEAPFADRLTGPLASAALNGASPSALGERASGLDAEKQKAQAPGSMSLGIVSVGGTIASAEPKPPAPNETVTLQAFTVASPAKKAAARSALATGGIAGRDVRRNFANERLANDKIETDTAERRSPATEPASDASHEETNATKEPVSTFSLHVSDVSFRLAVAAVAAAARGEDPPAPNIRAEEFYNAFDYGDPAPAVSEKIDARIEQSIHPVLQQRNLLRIAVKVPASGRGAGQPLQLTVLLDTSGSMEREDRRLSVRRALEELIALLGPNDHVTLIGFARRPTLLAENVVGNQAGYLVDLSARTPVEGGTNIESALKLAGELALRHRAPKGQNRIVVLTDGAANLGSADPGRLATQVEMLRQKGVAFDACGIGLEGVGDTILEALTRKGDGRYYVVDRPEAADAAFARQLAGAFRPAAENVKLQVRFNPERVGQYRLIGFDQHRLREEDFRNDQVDAAELAANEAANAVYQIEVLPQGSGEVGDVYVRFRDPVTGQMVERKWTIPYNPQAPRFDRASPSIQLAGVAALLAEGMDDGPLAGKYKLGDLAGVVNSLRGHYANEPRVQELVTMFNTLRRLNRE